MSWAVRGAALLAVLTVSVGVKNRPVIKDNKYLNIVAFEVQGSSYSHVWVTACTPVIDYGSADRYSSFKVSRRRRLLVSNAFHPTMFIEILGEKDRRKRQKKIESREEIENTVQRFIASKLKEWFHQGLRDLAER
ncbi:hypothetical protein EVAR_38447_1 [Eumeta japonica]|uniref:Secreted protein n=1 Tax=Eumeta variegata TaxID=151549 RepID=A0A4C1WYA1_EUMVA|nr:hypothetical protein EVAR_38447_1 [Eumeta japonica]